MLKLTIYSPEKKGISQVPVTAVTLPTSEGQIQVLPGHALFLGSLKTGVIIYNETNGQESRAAVSTGFFRVKEDEVILLAETIEFASDIDISRARQAQIKAEEELKNSDYDPAKFRKYELKLQRALIRQQIASK